MSVCLQTFGDESNQEERTEVFSGSYDSVKWVYLPTGLNVDFIKGFACVEKST